MFIFNYPIKGGENESYYLLHFIRIIKDLKNEENIHLVNDTITETLLMIYKRLSEDKDVYLLNLLMDRFEELIYSGHNSILNRL